MPDAIDPKGYTDTLEARDLTPAELAEAIPIDKLEHIINLEVGDKVIFLAPAGIENRELFEMRNSLQVRLPGVDFVLISGQIQVSVLRKAGEGHGVA